MSVELWQQCVELLRDELPSQQFNTWIRPLQVEAEGEELRVYAPNRFVLDWVNEKYMGRLLELLGERALQGPSPEGADRGAALWTRDYLWTRAETILAGTSEVQRNILAEQMLGLMK